MGKFIRFYNQNRKELFKLIVIVLFGYMILLLTNAFIKEKSIRDAKKYIDNISNTAQVKSTNTVEKNNDSKESNKIKDFLDYCLSDEQKAYDMIHNETKKDKLYNTKEAFINNFINAFVKTGDKSNIKCINAIDKLYMVEIYKSDILSTGNIKDTKIKYLKIIEDKIIIQEYIEKNELDKKYFDDSIYINLKEFEYYKDYVLCEVVITNNSINNINIKDTYLLSSKSERIKQIDNVELEFKPYEKRTIKIKYNLNYIMKNSTEKMIFEFSNNKIEMVL